MATGPTKLADLFDPDVWGDMIRAEFKGRSRLLDWAVSNDKLQGIPGSEVHFPKWTTLEDLQDLNEDTDIELQKLSQTDGVATVKEVGGGFSYTDSAALNGMGDIYAEGTRQLGILAARKIDADLITESAAETPAAGKVREQKPFILDKSTLTKEFNWDVVVDAIALFGDEWEPDTDTGLFIRSEQMAQVMKDKQFINAEKLGSTMVTTGQIGLISGMPVIVTNRLPKNEFRIIRRGALGILYKRHPLVEYDRDIIGRKTVVTTNIHYAVKRINDKGVVVGKLQA